MALNLPIRYGGTVAGDEEYQAIDKIVRRSIETGGWQTADEAKAFEEESAAYLGLKYGVLTTSGSAAGLLTLAAFEFPKGSEVIIPATTFPTIFNIIIQCGLKPVVVDCEVGTYNIDLNKLPLLISQKTKAIIAVHAVGNPVDMPRLMKLIEGTDIKVIEDNCDGWGGEINGQKVGSFGHAMITSFHAAHIISTAGTGGGVYTNDEDLARKVRMYRDWGRQANINEPHKFKKLPEDYNPRFVYEKIGYNFQILELQAAMGRVQLKKTQQIKEARQANFNYLYNNLQRHPNLILPVSPVGSTPCWFAFPITVKENRAGLVKHLEDKKIETRSMFAGNILRHPAYDGMRFKHGDLSGADYIIKNSFWIGVHPRMSQEDREYVINAFDEYFKA